MKTRPMKKAGGFALMDLMLYMIIFSVLAAFAAQVKLSSDRDKADQAAGQHLAVIRDGVQQYIDLYRSQLLAGIAIPGIGALMAPTVAELQGLNNPPVMSTSIGVQGGNGQTYSITLTRLPAGCAAGVNCTDLFALISSTQPWMGDDGLPQTVRLANMAATVGGDGAIVDSSAPTTLKGADGTWAGVANPYGNAEGYVFARAGFGSVTDIKLNALLPRDGTRGITNIVTKGQACTVPNGLGADASGRVFSCQGGTYQLANGSGNISDTATLGTACTDDGALAKSVTDTSAILICSTGFWNLGAGNNVVLRDGSRSMLADLNMGGNSISNANDVNAAGRVTMSDALIGRVIVPNAACSPDGLVARDSNGRLFSCQLGAWKNVSGSSGVVATSEALVTALDGTTVYVYANATNVGQVWIGTISFSGTSMTVSPSNSTVWTPAGQFSTYAQTIDTSALVNSTTGFADPTLYYCSNCAPLFSIGWAQGVLAGTGYPYWGNAFSVTVNPLGITGNTMSTVRMCSWYGYYYCQAGDPTVVASVTCGQGASLRISSDVLYANRGTTFSYNIGALGNCTMYTPPVYDPGGGYVSGV